MIMVDSAIPQFARPYQGKPAGLISRLLASSVDFLIVVAALAGLYVGWAALRFLLQPTKFTFPDPSLLLILAAGFTVLTLYLALAWMVTGRTYGDHLMGLRVVDRSGGRLHLVRALLRALLCAVFPLGLLWTAVNSRNHSVQDILIRTSVMYDWHTIDPGR
jgi:uncharacterized RDD family membrane protein YckC